MKTACFAVHKVCF